LTEPYIDFFTGGVFITVAKAVYESYDRRLFGVAGIDIKATEIARSADNIKWSKTGFVVVVTKSGTVVNSPDFWFPGS
jgi:hypothetical protein